MQSSEEMMVPVLSPANSDLLGGDKDPLPLFSYSLVHAFPYVIMMRHSPLKPLSRKSIRINKVPSTKVQ